MHPKTMRERREAASKRAPLKDLRSTLTAEEKSDMCIAEISKADHMGFSYFAKLSEKWESISRENMYQTRTTYGNKAFVELKDYVRAGLKSTLFNVSVTPWAEITGASITY